MADATQLRADLVTRYLGIMPNAGEDQILRLVVETGVRAIGADEGSLLVYDPQANDLVFTMTYGQAGSEEILLGERVPFGKGITGLAAATGDVQIGAPRYTDVRQTEAVGKVEAVIAAPMMLGDRLVGVITAVSNKRDKRFSSADGELFACLATIAALVVNQTLRLREGAAAGSGGADPLSLAADPAEQEVMDRVIRLLQRDTASVRQLARMLEAVEAMAPAGAPR